MASELETTNSVSINDPNDKLTNKMNEHSNDSNMTNSDYDSEGEWELAGAKSMMKKSSTQTFTQSPKSSNRRRRRLNSSNHTSTNGRSAKTPLAKSKSNHVELSNLVNNNSNSNNNSNGTKVPLEKPNDSTSISNVKVRKSHSKLF